MTKLHEVLAAEKTRTAAWNNVYSETVAKLKNAHFFQGEAVRLSMIESNAENQAQEEAALVDKSVITSVHDTLDYLLDLFAESEDLQYQKNVANRIATGTVMFDGEPFLTDMPIDQLLGLESRLGKIREMILIIPTLDASREWLPSVSGKHIWRSHEEVSTKTEKQLVTKVAYEATKEHPAQIREFTRDVVVGRFVRTRFSGAVTAAQKADMIRRIDTLLVEVKQARMRANEAQVTKDRIGKKIVALLLSPLLG